MYKIVKDKSSGLDMKVFETVYVIIPLMRNCYFDTPKSGYVGYTDNRMLYIKYVEFLKSIIPTGGQTTIDIETLSYDNVSELELHYLIRDEYDESIYLHNELISVKSYNGNDFTVINGLIETRFYNYMSGHPEFMIQYIKRLLESLVSPISVIEINKIPGLTNIIKNVYYAYKIVSDDYADTWDFVDKSYIIREFMSIDFVGILPIE